MLMTDSARPMRKRGVLRHNLLLDATEKLLTEKSEEDVGLAQIAEEAGVPLASAYHFFPNRDAAFVALANRFNDHYYRMAIQPMPSVPESWQEIVITKQKNAVAFQNKHPAVMRLFLGAGVSINVRAADRYGSEAVARSRVKYFEAYFQMPCLPDIETRISISMALQDGIWALSYARHGMITALYAEASAEASISYLRNYLPAHLVARELTAEALAEIDVLGRGQSATDPAALEPPDTNPEV